MRPRASIAANPVLIGAATVLVAIVGVFLAYGANNGLPFVPTYAVHIKVPNATALVKGNDVRIAGSRIGIISAIDPEQNPRTGRVSAVLTVKLDKSVEPLPVNSTVIVRARSAIGLKYLEIKKGDARRGVPEGGTLPLSAARPEPVEIDQVFNTFDEPTRTASEENLEIFANAFAGRGIDLNTTFATLPHLLGVLTPVMTNLADPRTGFDRLFPALAQTAAAVAPVAEQQAAFFAGLDDTFSAMASVAPALEESIAEGPESLRVATESFRRQAPFLEKTTRFFTGLQPAIAAADDAAGPLGAATSRGAKTLTDAVGLNRRLTEVLDALAAFGQDQEALTGIGQVNALTRALGPLVDTLEPMQLQCNYPGSFLRNFASAFNDGDQVGTWLRFSAILTPTGPNGEGGPSSSPANGPTLENHLHTTPYPNVSAPGQPKACEAGNQYYTPGATSLTNLPDVGSIHDAPTETRLIGSGAPTPPPLGAKQ